MTDIIRALQKNAKIRVSYLRQWRSNACGNERVRIKNDYSNETKIVHEEGEEEEEDDDEKEEE